MQEKKLLTHQEPAEEYISLKKVLIGIINWVRYLFSKWYLILIFVLMGAVAGFYYASTKKTSYTAVTTFVLEGGESKSGIGQYAGLASVVGIDIGSAGGLFQGENILELYKSRSMISQALLSPYKFNGKEQLLIDRFIEFNNLRKKWSNEARLKNIRFEASNIYSSPLEQLLHDSLIEQMVNNIRKNYLAVSRPDKKLNIINVLVKAPDELFAKAFNEQLVQTVNNFYLSTKTKRSLENVAILQSKADSVRSRMAGAINTAAAIADATPNQNLTRMAQKVAPIQNAKINTELNQAILGTLIQNLEMSKIALLKETPLIQIVDKPVLPLTKNSFSKVIGIVMGAVIGGFLVSLILLIRKFIKNILSGE